MPQARHVACGVAWGVAAACAQCGAGSFQTRFRAVGPPKTRENLVQIEDLAEFHLSVGRSVLLRLYFAPTVRSTRGRLT